VVDTERGPVIRDMPSAQQSGCNRLTGLGAQPFTRRAVVIADSVVDSMQLDGRAARGLLVFFTDRVRAAAASTLYRRGVYLHGAHQSKSSSGIPGLRVVTCGSALVRSRSGCFYMRGMGAFLLITVIVPRASAQCKQSRLT